jgi:hypothetical protein
VTSPPSVDGAAGERSSAGACLERAVFIVVTPVTLRVE